jgi:hypothetical protein
MTGQFIKKNCVPRIRDTSEKQPLLSGFETPFGQNLDPNNCWVKLVEIVPWDTMAWDVTGI